MTKAEHAILKERGLLGQVRQSCQVVCDHDMGVRPAMTVESQGWDSAGPTPATTVTPEAMWYAKAELERAGANEGA